MKRSQFLENYPIVFPIVIIPFGQVFTTWDFLHFQATDICSGIRSIDKQNKPHRMTWVDVEEENVMKAYIARHKDKNVLELLENAKKNWHTVALIRGVTLEPEKQLLVLPTRQLEDTKKILNPCIRSSMITSRTIKKFLLQSYFNCWLADTWEQDFLMKNVWIVNILIEVQRHYPVCFVT